MRSGREMRLSGCRATIFGGDLKWQLKRSALLVACENVQEQHTAMLPGMQWGGSKRFHSPHLWAMLVKGSVPISVTLTGVSVFDSK